MDNNSPLPDPKSNKDLFLVFKFFKVLITFDLIELPEHPPDLVLA